MLSLADVHGAYVWDTTLANPGNDSATRPLGRWRQICIASAIAATLPDPYPGNGFGGGQQVYAARIAPNNTNRMYMYSGNGYDFTKFYTSTDKGRTWTVRSAAPGFGTGSNGASKFIGPHMAVDPFNEQVVLLGTSSTGTVGSANSSGAYRSADAGASWAQISTAQLPVCITMAADQTGGHIFAFDASSRSSGDTPTIYAATYGRGVYRSTDYGANWTLLNSARMPLWVCKLFVDLAGVVWAIGQPDAASIGSGHLLKYQAGVWTDCTTGVPSGGGIAGGAGDGALLVSVAVEPIAGAGRKIVVSDKFSAGVFLSSNEGANWGVESYGAIKVAADIPWIATTPEWSIAHLYWAADGNVWMAMGIGVYFAPGSSIPTTNTPVTWTSRSIGNEMLVCEWIISPPAPTSTPVVGVMDRDVFRSPQTSYPTTLIAGTAISHGRGLDYASSDPTFISLLSGGGNVTANARYSTNGGTSWNTFINQPGGGSLVTSGTIASASATNHVAILNYNGGLWYTKDNGATPWLQWGGVNPAGGWRSFSVDHRRMNVIADRVNIGTFYAYCDGGFPANQAMGFYKSTDGGANWVSYFVGVYHTGFTSFPGNPDTFAYEMQMRACPGVAGNFYCSTGRNSLSQQMPFYEIQDNGSSLVRTRIVGVDSVRSYGYGKPPTGTYPSIFIWGNVAAAQDTQGVGGVGVWRSDDHAVSWTRLGSSPYPNDSLDAPWIVSGDMNVVGKCYVGFYGSGVAEYNSGSDPIIPPETTTPSERTVKVPASNRKVKAAAQSRIVEL